MQKNFRDSVWINWLLTLLIMSAFAKTPNQIGVSCVSFTYHTEPIEPPYHHLPKTWHRRFQAAVKIIKQLLKQFTWNTYYAPCIHTQKNGYE